MTTDFCEFVTAADYHPRHLIPIVVQVPKTLCDAGLEDAIRSMFELYPVSITGIYAGLKWIAAKDRESLKVAMAKNLPSLKYTPHPQKPIFTFRERYGKPVSRLLDSLLKHRASTFEDVVEELNVLLIEPDPSHTGVMDAWLFKGMFPLSSGNHEMVRDVGRGLSTGDVIYDIEMAYRSVEHRAPDIEKQAQAWMDACNAGLLPTSPGWKLAIETLAKEKAGEA